MDEILWRPLSKQEIEQMMLDDEYVHGNIILTTYELINNDLEGVLDIISERLIESPLLMDINYSVVSLYAEDELVFCVTGIVDLEED